MDWDDEYGFGYGETEGSSHESLAEADKASLENGFNPTDITNPASAYFFLSDDARDEISGIDLKKMKCQSCGHRFKGEIYDSCPECFSLETEELIHDKNIQY